ncbi:Zinc finger protein 185 [Galemys pyrenaicus]|uniref:Zinc finger protein 185 n=1 Tax=Galemys pyrenaicus TaxID=202257 RepID=A0A8J5ZTJ9_GALPY|nr:Zinc finger protein 185 [Galemys pyrenaicus]
MRRVGALKCPTSSRRAPYNIRRSSSSGDPEEEEAPFPSDEQRRRSEAASSVLRKTAAREHSYVLSAAKKSTGVEVLDEDGPSEKKQDPPAATRSSPRSSSPPLGPEDQEGPSPREPKRDSAGEKAFKAVDPDSARGPSAGTQSPQALSRRPCLPEGSVPLPDEKDVHGAGAQPCQPGPVAASSGDTLASATLTDRKNDSLADLEEAEADHKGPWARQRSHLLLSKAHPRSLAHEVLLPRRACPASEEKNVDSEVCETWQERPAALRSSPARPAVPTQQPDDSRSPGGPEPLAELDDWASRACPASEEKNVDSEVQETWQERPAARRGSPAGLAAPTQQPEAPRGPEPLAELDKRASRMSLHVRNDSEPSEYVLHEPVCEYAIRDHPARSQSTGPGNLGLLGRRGTWAASAQPGLHEQEEGERHHLTRHLRHRHRRALALALTSLGPRHQAPPPAKYAVP